jgi:hypothetical protein
LRPDLFRRIGLDLSSRPEGYASLASDLPGHLIDALILVIALDFNEETSSEFQRFREGVARAIEPELAASAMTLRASFCPIPEAEGRLSLEEARRLSKSIPAG